MNSLWMEAAADVALGNTSAPPPPAGPTSRKRPRSTSPVPPSSKKSNKMTNLPDSTVLAEQLLSPRTRNEALNTLLKLTANHELNYAVEGESVLTALMDLVPVEPIPPPKELDPKIAWARCDLHPNLGNVPILHAVLVILRNLSFVAANLRPMAFHPEVLPLLITAMHLDHEHGDLVLNALHTLVHLAPVLDVTGQRLLCDTLFVNNEQGLLRLGFGGLGLAKQLDNDILEVDDDNKLIWEITKAHVQHIWGLFPALRHVLVNPTTPRLVLMMALDFIQELLDHQETSNLPNMKQILQELPMEVVQRLVDFLWIPRLGPDALDYVNPMHNIVSRVSTLKLLMGYDNTVDTDLRDRSLDVLVPLLNLSDDLVGNMSRFSPRLYDALFPILTTQVGRNDAPMMANSLLKALSRHKNNRVGLMYAQERILSLGSKNARVAQVALGQLYQFKIDDLETGPTDTD